MTIRLPNGFRCAGVACGLKSDPQREDLSLFVADAPCVAAGVYTQNLVYAAPVGLDRQRTPSAEIRAVVVNSGNANACTGERGWQDAVTMTQQVAAAIGAREEEVLVMSTGVIGEFLAMDKIASGIAASAAQLGTDENHLLAAARGILTTDQGVKTASAEQPYHITGLAKGAGMIAPRMATMLAVIFTDAPLTPDTAQRVLAEAVETSFNAITVDGHMSTNDTVLLLSSGTAGNGPLEGAALAGFAQSLSETCETLAKQIPADGEGASHLMAIEVDGCESREAAHQIARTVADSALVKTAITGNDPNWGRIISAAGYARVPLDPHKLALEINGIPIYQAGAPTEFDAATVSRSMRDHFEVQIHLHLHAGACRARVWSSDLTCDYVRFNSEYHT